MAKKTVTCDACGLVMAVADAHFDQFGGHDYCLEHYNETMVGHARTQKEILLHEHIRASRDFDRKIAFYENQIREHLFGTTDLNPSDAGCRYPKCLVFTESGEERCPEWKAGKLCPGWQMGDSQVPIFLTGEEPK